MDKPTRVQNEPIPEAVVFKAADAVCAEWNLHYPDAVRMAKVVLSAASAATAAQQQQAQVVAYIEHSADKSSAVHLTQAGMQLGIGRHACYTAAPPSAPVGVEGVEAALQKWLDWCNEHNEEPEARSGARVAIEALAQQPAAVDEAWQVQLAEALECFWNPAIEGSGDDRSNIIGGMVQGFAAVAYRLREQAALAAQQQEPKS